MTAAGPARLDLQVLEVIPPATCDGCGVCCEGIGSPVVLYASRPGELNPHPFRPAGLPASLLAEIDSHFAGLRRGEEPQERCLWFDSATRRCRHYEWRPPICREFELGGAACLAVRAESLQARADGDTPPSA
ncbi:MAG: YkgJ family cysteine cluster protein [Planctomycetaceae bacterium]|nr:YkgJ family cysteine cluster protein [Planctomycetaceae bacterium]